VFPFFEIFSLILRTSFTVFFEPMFLLVLLLVGFQYRQQQRSQERMFGIAVFEWKKQTMRAAWLGLMGGWLGSFLLTLTGVSVNHLGLSYIGKVLLISLNTSYIIAKSVVNMIS
jgi:uncharacterized membrane protein YdcZ (DUF606 family)